MANHSADSRWRDTAISPLLSSLDKYGGSIWERAACGQSADPDAWFVDQANADPEDLWRLKAALRVCENCPIKDKCLEVGLTDNEIEWGVWGGMLPGERLVERYAGTDKYIGREITKKINAAATLRTRIDKLKVGKNKRV